MKKFFIAFTILSFLFCSCKKGSKNTVGPVTGVISFSGSGTPGYKDGTASQAEFEKPVVLTIDNAGNMYEADVYNVIRKITPQGDVSTLAGVSDPAGGYQDGNGSSAKFNYIWAIVVDQSGNLFVADKQNNVIRKVTPSGVVSTYAGVAGSSGYVDGPASSAKFNFPAGLALDKAGNLYVTDFFNSVIREITPNGMVSTFAPKGTFDTPSIMATDDAGNFYVLDGISTNKITKISTDGTKTVIATNISPGGILLDHSGNIYFSDADNQVIKKITADGTSSIVAGTFGTLGYVNGPLLSSEFNAPSGIVQDASGNLYVADYNNNRIRKVVLQ